MGIRAFFNAEYCDVDLQTNYVSESGGQYDTLIRNVELTMQCDTGGKGAPVNSLYHFTCSAQDKLSTNPILPQSISMGSLGNLDSSGNLYAALPSGATVAATPQTPGRQWYISNPNVTQIPVTLTANGYDLSQTKPTFCVGQQITFSLNCPGLPMTNVFCNWSLGGKSVNALSNNSGGTYIYNSSLLHGPSNTAQCWYYNGPSGSASVGADFIISGRLLSTAVNGQFSIYRPSLTNWLMPSPPNPPYLSLYDGGLFTGEILRVGDTSPNGYIEFTVNVVSTNAGTACFTQIYDDQSYPEAYGSNVLDTAEYYPYTGGLSKTPPIATDAMQWSKNVISLSDTPWDSCGSVSGGLVLQVKDYARFRPNAGNPNANIYVTLGEVTWSVDANATRGTNGWALNAGSTVTPPSLNTSDEWPYWTTVH